MGRHSEQKIATALLIIGERENDCHGKLTEYRYVRAK